MANLLHVVSSFRCGRYCAYRRPSVCRRFASVSGTIYNENTNEKTTPVHVKLYTKEGCTLCDKVKDVLYEVRNVYPHTLSAVDITDDSNEEWWDRYKYDIPVLHINELYWTKHTISSEDAAKGIAEARAGTFVTRKELQPNAAKYERATRSD